MKINELSTFGKNRIAKIALGLFATIFVGALGSGLWELVLRDLFFTTGYKTLSLISSFWGGYVDHLHKEVGKLRVDSLVIPSFAAVVAFLILGPWALIHYFFYSTSRLQKRLTRSDQENSPTPEALLNRIGRLRKLVLIGFIPLSIITTTIYTVTVWQIIYTRNAANWAERSIEILRPQISQSEFNQLRADLRAIETADQFYALERQLHLVSKKKSVRLPAFEPIRR